jgi:hypothetical protein
VRDFEIDLEHESLTTLCQPACSALSLYTKGEHLNVR